MSTQGTKHWPKAKVEALKILWPSYPRKAVLDAFPGRSWHAIGDKARRLGLRRAWKFNGKTAPTKSDLMDDLRRARVARNLTAKRLSAKIGLCERYVSMAERGSMNPNLHTVERWCAALGVRLKVEVLGEKHGAY